jgi:hypothetical protein
MKMLRDQLEGADCRSKGKADAIAAEALHDRRLVVALEDTDEDADGAAAFTAVDIPRREEKDLRAESRDRPYSGRSRATPSA